MKPKTTLTLAAVLVVLAVIAVLSQASRRRSMSPAGGPIFPQLKADQAELIHIDLKDKPVELRKQGKDWIVATEGWHQADPKAVKSLLDAMDKFTTTTLVSTSPERQSAFQVDSTGIPVRIEEQGKAAARFIVGKPGPDYMSTYIRPQGQNKVYQVPVYMRSLVDRGSSTWRNQTILDLQPSDVTSFTTRNQKETVTLEKDAGGTWKVTAPYDAPAKADVVSIILSNLAPVRASGFADTTLTEPELGLAADTTDLTIKTTDGSSYKVVIGASNARNQSYVQREGDPTVYLVPRGRWNTVFRPSEVLRAPEPAASASPQGAGEAPAAGSASEASAATGGKTTPAGGTPSLMGSPNMTVTSAASQKTAGEPVEKAGENPAGEKKAGKPAGAGK